jgi:hypothetical protein
MLKRMRKVMESVKPGCIIDLHSNTGFSIGPATQYTGFFPYIDKLWFGESFMYNKMSPANWLIETSGIPFGLMGDMLYQCGNHWRGMLYGMSSRLGWMTDGIICDPKPVWKVWDAFGIADATMVGFWQPNKLVTTSDSNVLATTYLKKDSILIAVASSAKKPVNVKLNIDWKKIGWQPDETMLATAIESYQSRKIFKLNDSINVEPEKGWLLIVKRKK